MYMNRVRRYLTIEGKKVVVVSLLRRKRMSAVRCDDVASANKGIVPNNEPFRIQLAISDNSSHLGCGKQSAVVRR
jgi:hypothetical protein